jgi:CheY-like chemotaxis protein
MSPTLNILVAEDNTDDVFLLEQAFRKAGVTSRLTAVRDGVDAVDYLKGEGPYGNRAEFPFPDVLLLDLNMPRMNGFEVLEWVRQDEHCGQLIVYVLTASARESDMERAYSLCASGFIVKPNRLDELVAFVSALHQWHCFVSLPRRPANRKALAGSCESE